MYHHSERPTHPGAGLPGPYGPYRLALCPDTVHRHLAAARRARARVTAGLLQAALEALRRGMRAAETAMVAPHPARPTPR